MSNAATIIPFTTDSALSEVNKLSQLVDDLLELGAKLNNNAEQLKNVQKILRQQELKKQFLTLEEVADALHCEKKTATKALRERNVEIITAGKTYVVQSDNFLNAFRNV